MRVTKLALSSYEAAYADHLSVHHDYNIESNTKQMYKSGDLGHFMQMDEIYTKRLKIDFSNFDEDGARQNFLISADDSDTMQFQRDVVMEVECDTDVAAPTNYVAVHVCND